jgi:hypothetical protein
MRPLITALAVLLLSPQDASAHYAQVRDLGKPEVALATQAAKREWEFAPREKKARWQRQPEKVMEMKQLFTAWMKEAGARDLTPNPADDARKPLFNSRDEALKNDVKGAGKEKGGKP